MHPYLLNGLHAFSGDNITFYLNSSNKTNYFETEEQDKYNLTYLVMPVSAQSQR